jgi:uncharacterized membrane protein
MKLVPPTTVLSAAIGLALAIQGAPASAAQTQDNPEMKQKTQKEQLEQCYGIAAAGKNDCAAGAHSCSGQATKARDPKSFVLVPVGLCAKIQGGKLKAS